MMGAGASNQQHYLAQVSRQKRAALAQALSKKLDKHKKFGKTIRKLIKYNSKQTNKNQCRLFHDMLQSWSTLELTRLVELYESTIELHRVTSEASSARSPALTVPDYLVTVYECKTCPDVILKYREQSYPVHNVLLTSRSLYFRKALKEILRRTDDDTVTIPVIDGSIDDTLFNYILIYIYSERYPPIEVVPQSQFDSIIQKYAVHKSLSTCMKYLQETSYNHNVKLKFVQTSPACVYTGEMVTISNHPCHSFVLASHSPLLASLIERRRQADIEANVAANSVDLILDETVVSSKYAPLLLKLMYQGDLDLSLLTNKSNSATASSLSEAQAISAGRGSMSTLEEVMQLHHVGRFLDFQLLVSKCEDHIVQSLAVDKNLTVILDWCENGSGSNWIYRQTLEFIQDNFLLISRSAVLYSLPENILSLVLQSDFLQASEIDILQAVISWSENQLIKQIENKEPNLVCHTAHSLARKGLTCKNDDDLRVISSELLCHVRLSHVLAVPNEPIIANAIKRGLLPTNVSPKLAASEPNLLNSKSQTSWVPPTKSSHDYQIPRGYHPFYDTARQLLEERTRDVSQSDVLHLRRPNRPHPHNTVISRSNHIHHSPINNMETFKEEFSRLPLAEESVQSLMSRTQELLQTSIVIEALQTCWDKHAVLKQVCLWAARELDLPDQIIYTFKSSSLSTRTSSSNLQTQQPDFIPHSLVPDLAPERLLLQHGLSASLENLTVHSVGSSPDVTLLSVRRRQSPLSKSLKRRDKKKQAPHQVEIEAELNINTPVFPDITIHSQSSTGSSDSTDRKGAVARRPKKSRKLRKPSSARQLSSESALPPDLLDDTAVTQHHDIISQPDMQDSTRTQLHRYAATLDSCARRRRMNPQVTNPYHTPPRMSPRRSVSSRLITNSLIERRLQSLGSAGPPPDIMAPIGSSRRFTGSATPPDITSSPSNTWHAML